MTLPRHHFWDYSLKIYENHIVKECCLALQNQYRLNVNLLLFSLWFAHTGRGKILPCNFERILQEIQPWHTHITQEIRALRCILNTKPKLGWTIELRDHVLKDELLSENIEQLLIAEVLPGLQQKNRSATQKARDALTNLKNYYTTLHTFLDYHGYELTQRLISEAFPGILKKTNIQLDLDL